MQILFFLLISLVLILISCMIFSNAIEWLGVKLKLSHGVTGSILAAVGTALPETMVPIVAIFWGVDKDTLIKILMHGADSNSPLNEISMGAIIGAPFMLCTLAFFLIGLSSLIYFKTGRRESKKINVDETVLMRDLRFFTISFSIAFIAIFTSHIVKVIIAALLIILYFVYVIKTLREEKDVEAELEDELEPLIFHKLTPLFKPELPLIISQLVVSLIMLVFSAHHFVQAIKELSHELQFPAFIISLLLAPLATELPEKFNSWLWIRGKKDTLAVGNVSGALVFQSTFPVSIGLLFTSWQITQPISYFIFGFCLVNAIIVLTAIKRNKLNYKVFLACGSFYLVYLILILFMH